MIEVVAEKLKASLKPDDLALLQGVLVEICSARGEEITSPELEKYADNLIILFQSGIRVRRQLVAMLTGQIFP
ncbi:hypothetical protein ASE36_20140 [Rhizobium sp. Root274]|uniref:hypothetical protein n=1 Tax=unclassified Rhizobium TaxID=2613769 RepID=UPI000715D586|nr:MULTISPECIES: hypothetical protein [unclassified Rhizobium]KQW26301.1 hypothetical protein ASC71_20185 [Rhizobium sp. Root1240]KRD26276.1 hypothetical protein ASE36_20140 [Rhizobium sp. Root274]